MASDDFPNISSVPPQLPQEQDARDRRTVLLQMFQLSGSNVVIQAARLFKNLYLASFFGPATFGVWNALQVFITYGMNVHLGALQTISRDIPMKLGSGDADAIPRLADAGYTISVVSSVAGGVIISLLAAFVVTEEAGRFATAFLLLPILVAQMLFLFGQSLLRAEDSFGPLSKALSVAAVLELAGTLLLIYLIGFSGILIGLACSQGLGAIICLRRRRPYRLKFILDRETGSYLIRAGFPIMLTVLGYFLLTTIDRLVIITAAGSESLGYYSLGSLAIAGIGYIPIAINQVMLPKFALRFGATGDPATLSGYLRVPTLASGYAMSLVLGAGVLFLPLIVLFLPEYSPGIPAATILLAGFYFVAVTGSCANLLVTLNRQGEYLWFLGGAIILAVALDYTVLAVGWGIEAVAAVTGAVDLLFMILLLEVTTRRHLPQKTRPFGFLFGKLFLPWVTACSCVGLAEVVSPGVSVVSVLVKLVIFAALYAPFSFFMLKREKVL